MSIGSGKLNINNLAEVRVNILKDIERLIEDEFRENAKKDNENRLENRTKKYNNVISILGGRGSGKTSMGITVLDELRKKEKENIILDVIDPALFNVEKNSLGWVLYLLKSYIDKLSKNNVPYCKNKDFSIEDEYKNLKTKYVKSRSYFKDNLAILSGGAYDFQKISEESIFAEIGLEKDFKKFIDKFVHAFKENNKDKEPLIFITFDDVDLNPQVGPEILNTVLNYLDHPNIVVLILGDYGTFKESLVLDLWNKSKVSTQIDKDTIINKESILNEFDIRAEDLLGKVLPPVYRYKLEGLSLEDRLRYTPMGDDSVEKLINKFQDITYNVAVRDNSKEVSSLLNWFIEPLIDISSLDEKYSNMQQSNRTYDGFIPDNYLYKDYCNNYKEYESKSLINSFIKSWKNNNDLVFKPCRYSNALPDTPRSLISLYYDLEQKAQLREPLYYLFQDYFLGYEQRSIKAKNNFEVIYNIYSSLKNNNINLNINKNQYDLDNIIQFDLNRFKLKINLTNLKFKCENVFKYSNFNCSQLLLKCIYEDEKGIYELNNTQSAFIQLIYDLAMNFLDINEYVEVNGTIDFSDIIIYRDNDNDMFISMIETKTFEEYYIFMKLYELCLPVIIQDRKVQRNIRDRLKLFIGSSLKYLTNYRNDKESKFTFLDNIDEDTLDSLWNTFFSIKNIENTDNTMNMLYFLRYFNETSNPYELYFEHYISNDNVLMNYNRLASLINNTTAIEQRTVKIDSILEEVEKIDNEIIALNNVFMRIKELNKTKNWDNIRHALFIGESIFVLRIAIDIYNDYISREEKVTSLHKLIELYLGQFNRIIKVTKINKERYRLLYNQVYAQLIRIEKDLINNTQTIINEINSLITSYEGKKIINNIKAEISKNELYNEIFNNIQPKTTKAQIKRVIDILYKYYAQGNNRLFEGDNNLFLETIEKFEDWDACGIEKEKNALYFELKDIVKKIETQAKNYVNQHENQEEQGEANE